LIPRFSLRRPGSLIEAMAQHDASADAAYIAGGTELLQVMKMGFAQYGTLIDLKRLPELQGLDVDDRGDLRIGANTTHRQLEHSQLIRDRFPSLAALEARVANVRVRNTGTIGGNLAFAEPHSDPATYLLACGATIVLEGTSGRRELAVDAFILGPLFTAREPSEVLIEIRLPGPEIGEGRAYDKISFFERPAASVAVRLVVADGAISSSTVSVGSMTDTPQVIEEASAAFVGAPAEMDALRGPMELAQEAFWTVDAVADLNGSADYKRYLAGVLLERTTRAALQEALPHA
jgi:carbon-monoxide dehydrogenase medium subunit